MCLCNHLRYVNQLLSHFLILFSFVTLILGSLRKHDDDGNKNLTNLHTWQWKTVFLHALHVHFSSFDILKTFSFFLRRDLFCSCVDDVSMWWQMFNFVLLCPKRWFQLGPVHTYPDIFESATFSFRIRKYPRPHVMWSQRIHIEFARPHVFGFTPDSLRIDKIFPLGTGSSRSNPQSSRTALLSYSFKLFLPAVLSGR